MPREGRDKQHARWRADAEATAKVAGRVIEVVAVHVPKAALFVVPLVRLLEPVKAPTEFEARASVSLKMIGMLTPYAVVLGTLYQGAQGALIGALTSVVQGLMAGIALTKNDKGEWTMNIVDAIWIASFLPIIVHTLSKQDVERAGLVGL